MWLLNTTTLEPEELFGDVPKYGIARSTDSEHQADINL